MSLHKLKLHIRGRLPEEACKRLFLLAHHLCGSLGMCQASKELGTKDRHPLDMSWEMHSPGKSSDTASGEQLPWESIASHSQDRHVHTGSHSRKKLPGRILRNLSGSFLKVIVTRKLSWKISASLGHFHRGAGSRQAAE